MLTPTYTQKYFEWTFMFIVYYSLCFTIYDKVRGEKFGTHVKQLLVHKPSVILIARLSLFLVYVYRYPRDWITKCLARREWIPLYRVGPESISLHREGANSNLELSPLLDTLSNVPRTYFTNSHLLENSSKNQSTSSRVKQLDTLIV